MRLHLTLSGTFHRTPLNQSTQAPVSLEAWMQTDQAVATQVRRRSPQLLRQLFTAINLSMMKLKLLSNPTIHKFLIFVNEKHPCLAFMKSL